MSEGSTTSCRACGAVLDASGVCAPCAGAARRGSASPLGELLRIAAPSVATMTSYTLMQFVDKLIVSRIGPEPVYVGAQGNGGLAAWIAISIAMGTLTIINTYVSQNLGAGTPRRGPAYAWNGLWIAAAFWAVVLLPFAAGLPWVLRATGLDPVQSAMGAQYGRILLCGAVITMWTRALSQFFYGMHRAGVVLVAGVIANALNLFLAWVLVFGKFGLPALGVAGSGYATVLATAVELCIPAAVFLGPKFNSLYATRSQWRLSWAHVRDIVRLGWPGGVMFGNEMVCWGFFMIYLVSHFGRLHATAGWIAHQYMQLSFMPAVGISVACTALVGKYMGMRRPDLAARRAWLGLMIAVGYMVVCAVVFVAFRGSLVGLFIEATTAPGDVAEVVRLGSMFLIAAAAFQAFDAVAMTTSGSLRGAGDTVVPGLVTVVLSWGVIVGGGYAMVNFAPGLGSLGPWIAAASYIVLLSVFLLGRFLSGRWRSLDVLGHAAGSAQATPALEPVGAGEGRA